MYSRDDIDTTWDFTGVSEMLSKLPPLQENQSIFNIWQLALFEDHHFLDGRIISRLQMVEIDTAPHRLA